MIYSDTEEQWKPVPIEAFARAYEVSSMGRVRGINRVASSEYFIRRVRGVILKGRIRRDGLKTVNLSVNRHRGQFGIHQLVALVFVPNPDRLPEVRHISTDILDNRAVNLVWGAAEDRLRFLAETTSGAGNAQYKGEIIATNVMTGQQVSLSGKKQMLEAGFLPEAVYRCVNGFSKSHYGYTFSRIAGGVAC